MMNNRELNNTELGQIAGGMGIGYITVEAVIPISGGGRAIPIWEGNPYGVIGWSVYPTSTPGKP